MMILIVSERITHSVKEREGPFWVGRQTPHGFLVFHREPNYSDVVVRTRHGPPFRKVSALPNWPDPKRPGHRYNAARKHVVANPDLHGLQFADSPGPGELNSLAKTFQLSPEKNVQERTPDIRFKIPFLWIPHEEGRLEPIIFVSPP